MSTVLSTPASAYVVRLRGLDLTDDAFLAFCTRNPDLRFERTAAGEILVMPPAGGESSRASAATTALLWSWSERDATGVCFDSSAGFRLPNGAIRSPDAAWVRRSRWQQLRPEQREKFVPLCPDFVVEILSPSDRLADAEAKMREWIDNGCALGWLIEPRDRRVSVYRPGADVERLDDPATLSGDPVAPGFRLDLARVFSASE